MKIVTRTGFTQRQNLSAMNKLIHKEVNYNFLLSRLKCEDNCVCARYVNSIKIKHIEENPLVWIKIANLNKNEWCPIGPQPMENYIKKEDIIIYYDANEEMKAA